MDGGALFWSWSIEDDGAWVEEGEEGEGKRRRSREGEEQGGQHEITDCIMME